MKNFKKFTAAVAATLIAATLSVPMAMSVPASAVDITVTDTQGNATKNYSAYKILDASVDSASEAYTYHLNDTYKTILQSVTGKETEDDIIAYIGTLASTTGVTPGEEGNMRDFADKVYKAILAANIQADLTTTNASFSDVAQGYYLIAQDAVDGGNTSTSLVMVDTAGDVDDLTVTVKKDLPSFDKQIGDINDTETAVSDTWNATDYTWGTDADFDKYAKDDVPFRLIATLPTDYASYEHYTLTFHDDLDGNKFGTQTIKAVYVEAADGTKTAIDVTNYTVGAGCGETHGTAHVDGCDFTVTIEDLKTVVATAAAGDKVIVEYTAPFTDNTVVGSAGNWNTGLLEYSNNPYNSGYGANDNTTGETPEVNVVAFTYKTVINKIKKSDQTALAGAAFKLEKKLSDGTYEVVEEFTAGTDTTFTFEGLDDGEYMLSETTPPQGYNPIDPISFTVSATHADKALTALTGTATDGVIEFTADVTAGSLTSNVENESGAKLPSTGGMGTTLFYVGGGCMVAVAGIFLITKKRMGKKEN